MEKYKQKLEEEKKLLEIELQSMGKEDETGDWEATPEAELKSQDVSDDGDMAERAEDYEERSSTLNVLEKRLADIDNALAKIGTDLYGKCEVCNIEIGEDRLEVNPSARTCEACMNKK